MNKTVLGAIVASLILIGVAIAVMMPRQASDKTTPAATPPSQQTTQPAADTQNTATMDVKVEIKDFAFAPATITVKKGTKVTWTNQDTVRHDVTSDDGAPTGGPGGPLVAKGESYSFTFNTVGSFSYHCTPHPNMKGTVTVIE